MTEKPVVKEKGGRTFTDAQLEEMGKNFNRLALEALDSPLRHRTRL